VGRTRVLAVACVAPAAVALVACKGHTTVVKDQFAPGTSHPNPTAVRGVIRQPGGRLDVLLSGPVSPRPTAHHAIVIPPSPHAPQGVIGMVDTATPTPHHGFLVITSPATLDQAYTSFDAEIDAPIDELVPQHAAGGKLTEGRLARGPLGEILPVSLTCNASQTPTIKVNLNLSSVDLDFDVADITKKTRSIGFGIDGTPSFELTTTLPPEARCEGRARLRIPVAHTGLFVHLDPEFTVTTHGRLESTLSWRPKISYGFATGKSAAPYSNKFNASGGSVTLVGDAGATFKLLLDAQITLAGRVGIGGAIGPIITAHFTGQADQSTCLETQATFEARLKGHVNVFFKHFPLQTPPLTLGPLSARSNCGGSIGSTGSSHGTTGTSGPT
jgi:hypothetical protein